MSNKCEDANLTQSSIIVDDYTFWITPQTCNLQGNFVSSYKLQYFKDGRLGGIVVGFEPMADIINMTIQYRRS